MSYDPAAKEKRRESSPLVASHEGDRMEGIGRNSVITRRENEREMCREKASRASH